jgi:transketolase
MAKEKENKEPVEDPVTQHLGKIETIRDILFGQQIESYEAEFNSLKKRLEAERQTMESKVDSIHKELSNAISQLNARMTETIQKNHDFTLREIKRIDHEKTNREALGEWLIELGTRLKKTGKS